MSNLGVHFQIEEQLLDRMIDNAVGTKRFWRIRKFLDRPNVGVIIKKGSSKHCQLTRNVQLIEFAVIGMISLRIPRKEIKKALVALLKQKEPRNKSRYWL